MRLRAKFRSLLHRDRPEPEAAVEKVPAKKPTVKPATAKAKAADLDQPTRKRRRR